MQTENESSIERTVSPYYLSFKKDGIMYVRVSPEKEETVPLAKEMVKLFGEMVNHQKVPMLAWHESGAIPPKENREFWAKKNSCPFSLADAFIIQSLPLKLIANFYLRINKPERPTRFFTEMKEAVKWLKTFLNEDKHIKGAGPASRLFIHY